MDRFIEKYGSAVAGIVSGLDRLGASQYSYRERAEARPRSRAEARWVRKQCLIPPAKAGGKEEPAEAG